MQTPSAIVSGSSFLLLGLAATAQCAPQWQAGDPLPHVRGRVSAAVSWDADVAGPLPPRLVVGGAFSAGTESSVDVAVFDGSQWTALEPGPGPVSDLFDWNGLLVASVSVFGGEGLCFWTGSVWQPFGGVSGSIRAICSYNGDLYVAGAFSSVGATAANGIARWTGSSWSPLGSGTTGVVHAMTVFNNLLYIGGSFTSVGGVAVGNMAAWNGSAWLPTSPFNGTVESLGVRTALSLSQNQLFAGGSFTSVGSTPAQHIARTTASSGGVWSAVGGGVPGTGVAAMAVASTGLSSFELAVAVVDPGTNQKVWRWNGTTWTGLGDVIDTSGEVVPTCLTRLNGQFVLGLESADQNVRRHDGVGNWPPVRGRGLADRVHAIDADGSDLVIGGEIPTISGVAMNHIARGGPDNWQPLGTGVEPTGTVFAVARAGNGDILAGGTFASAGGIAAANIARWNGSTWAPLGAGLNGTVRAIRVMPTGDVIATGAFTASGATPLSRIARWNGTNWSALGAGLGAPGNALAVAANGDLLVGGEFVGAGSFPCNRIARWNGSSWSPLGAGFDDAVLALTILPNGSVVAGGRFQNSGSTSRRYVAIWNGSTWSTPTSLFFRPTGPVFALTALPDGDFIAAGPTWNYFNSNPPITVETAIARHYGTGWDALDAIGQGIWALARRPNGTVVAGGEFHPYGLIVSENLAQWAPPCPATATAYGAGCTGSGGANVLTATELPWLGGSFRGLATGMPTLGFAVAVTGFTAIATPIAAILPQGLPGCTALVSPDALDIVIPSAGSVTTQLAIPASGSLISLQVRQQVVPFEADLAGGVAAVTSTNALLLTLGVL